MRQLLKSIKSWKSWGQGESSEETQAASLDDVVESPSSETINTIFFEDPVLLKRDGLLKWQDTWTMQLPQRWAEHESKLTERIFCEIDNMGLLQQVRKTSFFKNKLRPMVEEYVRVAQQEIALEIQLDLNRLGLGVLVHGPMNMGEAKDLTVQGVGALNVGLAAAPLLVGAAAVPVAIKGGVVTSAVAFGLFATSTVAWPVVAGGVSIAALLGATGVVKTHKLFALSKSKYSDAVSGWLFQTLVYSEEQNAVAQQMQKQVFAVAQAMLSDMPVSRDTHRGARA